MNSEDGDDKEERKTEEESAQDVAMNAGPNDEDAATFDKQEGNGEIRVEEEEEQQQQQNVTENTTEQIGTESIDAGADHLPNSNRSGRKNNAHRNNNKYFKSTRERTTGQHHRQQRQEKNRSKQNEATGAQENKTKQPPKTKEKDIFPPHESLKVLLEMYTRKDPTLIRGKLRVLPSSSSSSFRKKKDALSFVSCDRGSLKRDVVIPDSAHRNRALDGDEVFVKLICKVEKEMEEGKDRKAAPSVVRLGFGSANEGNDQECPGGRLGETQGTDGNSVHDCLPGAHTPSEEALLRLSMSQGHEKPHKSDSDSNDSNDAACGSGFYHGCMWADDEVQRSLWNPLVDVPLPLPQESNAEKEDTAVEEEQWKGKVVFVIPPKVGSPARQKRPSEVKPADESYRTAPPTRTIVGTLCTIPGQSSVYVLVPNSKSLPRFVCPSNTKDLVKKWLEEDPKEGNKIAKKLSDNFVKAQYVYGSWHSHHNYPHCRNLEVLGSVFAVEAETEALLEEFGVNHGEFSPQALKNVDDAIESGRYVERTIVRGADHKKETIGWKPTPEMCSGRRDYRKQRIFTIDPTTAKDLDDAVHVQELSNGKVEIGVHIADVSHFVRPGTAVDEEAEYRATTVYLVDRTVPMLPRPLCEVACSLNENVERLAFSCVWIMNKDGTLANKDNPKSREEHDVWFGRTVIKSCARLDYATAQNIIDHKVANGESTENVDETLWPKSRQPQGKPHTIDAVAADVRLLHQVAQARRRLRFEKGALHLEGIKLTFELPDCVAEEPPLLSEPYPIRDSNRLIEEYMLLANYLVSQHLILHARDRALLRRHPSPNLQGMQNLVHIAKESMGFEIDASTSSALQKSLNRLGQECKDTLAMQCITELAMSPMMPAEYFSAGELDRNDWHHFGLHIPYYTHFTSPIRRYADVIVHRLLQATIDDAVSNFAPSSKEINGIACHCNEKRMAADRAQERSDRVFLALSLLASPLDSTLGVVLTVFEKTFMVFCPDLGVSAKVFVDEHSDTFDSKGVKDDKLIRMIPKTGNNRTPLEIRVFAKLEVSCRCNENPPPLDVKIKVLGPWKEDKIMGSTI